MNNRERIINTILGRETDRAPFFIHMVPWPETEERWRGEGLGQGRGWKDDFGFDAGFLMINEYGNAESVNLGYSPLFTEEVLEDKGETVIVRDTFGVIKQQWKESSAMPRYLEHPVKTMEDWEGIKALRLNPEDPSRFPANWDEIVERLNGSDYCIQMGDWPYGLFGFCRELMGVEELLVSFYTQPELVRDMMDYLTDFWITMYEKICSKVKVDCIHMWEDMSGRQGSLISPAMVKEFMLPNYKKIWKFCQEHDISIFSVDTDGNVDELIPLFMEAGVNFMFPFEVAAGCDILKYRGMYPELGIMGGIDKREIAGGRGRTDRELERVASMLKYGRYIPALDHGAHPEISWEDFKYYIFRLKYIIGV